MRSFKIAISFSFIFFIYGCAKRNHSKTIIVDKFPKTYSLKGKSINKIKNDIYPLLITLKDSLLVICDPENSPHFYIYSVPDFKFVNDFGEQGKAPNQLDNPVIWDQIYKIDNTYYLWIYQINSLKMSLVNLTKAMKNKELQYVKNIVMPPETDDAVNILSLNDTIMVGNGSTYSQSEFFTYNTKRKTFNTTPFSLININESYKDELLHNGLLHEYRRGIIKLSPDKQQFIKVCLFSPEIDIYSNNFEKKLTILYKTYTPPKIDSKSKYFDKSSRIYFANVFLTRNYIYVLNMNCTLNQYYTSKANNVTIDVFKWDGKPECKYKLNEGIIASGAFVVDENNSKIYTVNPKTEFDYFSSFDIPEKH